MVERDEAGRWTWRLRDRFGKVLALAPKSYETRADCLVAIAAAKAGLGACVREANPRPG